MSKLIDLTGQRFGRLIVTERAESLTSPCGSKRARWICQCDCGNTVIVAAKELMRGDTKSCGCLQRDRTAEVSTTHGMKKTKIYHVWIDMKQRCLNPNNYRYSDWGGRGITVCNEWHEFEPFRDWALAHGYQDGLTIDRIDNNGPYSPDNCRWITAQAQQFNKRCNIVLTHNEKTQTLTEWAHEVNISPSTLSARLRAGWSLDRALTEPVHIEKGKHKRRKNNGISDAN